MLPLNLISDQEITKIGAELRSACDLALFRLQYQPQFDLKTGELVGAEALLRCDHEPLAGVAVNHIIHVAEHLGLIDHIGHWAFGESCRQLSEWLISGYAPISIAVNVSSFQLLSGLLNEKVPAILRQYNIPAEFVELEVTETQSILGDQRCVESLEELRDMGFRIAIDDFGTGYSSLSYLKRLNVHKLKIDRVFVQHLPFSSADRAIVDAIIGLGETMGIEILAEGVETEEQAIYLTHIGCGAAQGYLYGKPVDAGIFEKDHLALPRAKTLSIPL